MPPYPLEYRVLENGPSWYWEVVLDHAVLARGLADTRDDAYAQASSAITQDTETQPRSSWWPPSADNVEITSKTVTAMTA
jgi:hypothetical protein